jgi:hypothetical protein
MLEIIAARAMVVSRKCHIVSGGRSGKKRKKKEKRKKEG